ncbi:MAG: FMN-binding protein [Spirochaetales bacterium]|nr:FMN-binding protein [Spirochaetales bacterium]
MKKNDLKPDLNSLKGDLLIAAKLTLICFTAVLLLSIVNLLTRGSIERNNRKTEDMTNRYLIPDGVKFEKCLFDDPNVHADNEYYFCVRDSQNEIIGWTVSVMSKGYGGAMKIMAGFGTDWTVRNAKLLTNSETPGVGKEAERDEYMTKFIGTGSAAKPIPTKKSMLSQAEIDTVTGATITFNGVSSGITRAASLLKTQLTKPASTDETSDEQEASDEQ